MSKYTTQLRWPVEQSETGATSTLLKGQQFHCETYKKLGLDDYPIFDESYRWQLNDKIIRRYYFREIGLETMQQFAWYLRMRMFEIMPYYNQMYESTLLDIDPTHEIDMKYGENWDVSGTEDSTTDGKTASRTTNTHTNTVITNLQESANGRTVTDDDRVQHTESNDVSTPNTTVTTNSTTNDNGRTVYQDTPMSLLSNTDSPTVAGLDYATNVTYTDNNGGEKGSTTTTGTDTRTGSTKTYVDNGDLIVNTSDGHDSNTTVNDNGSSGSDRDGTSKYVDDKDTTEVGKRDKTEVGHRTNLSELLLKYRSTFVNIDVMILNEVADLFMGIY